MKLILSFLLILNVFSTVSSLMSLSTIGGFISDIVVYKNIHFITLFTCFNRHDAVKLTKIISKSYTPLNIIHLDSFEDHNNETTKKEEDLGFILDLSCDNYQKVLYMADKHGLYESRYKWLIIDTHNQVLKNHSSISETFANIPLRIDSDVTIALFNFENSTITFHDVYKPSFNTSRGVKVAQIGFWTAKNFAFTYKLSKYEQRKDMTGTVVNCGVVKTHTDATTSIDEYYRQVTINNYDTVNKLSYSLFVHITEIHNFTANITVTDKWFGGALGGIDEGLAKLLYENQLDVGISAGLLKPDRIPVIDFVAPAYPFRTCFIFRNPGTSSKVQNQFLKPFEAPLWFSILVCIVLFCAVLKFISFIERLLSNQNLEENSWAAASLLTWAVFCQQGATFVPKPTSGRCTVLSLLLMSLLLYNYYTSSIVSSLLSGLPPPFETIEELSHSTLKVGMEDVVYTRTLFEVTTDPRIKFLYKHKVLAHRNKPSYMKVEDGIARVKAGGFAYHTEPSTGYPTIRSMFEPYQICDLAEINVFTPTVLWVMIQKRGQYKKLFAIGYLKMLESGIISRQRSIWITKKPACLANTHLVQVGIEPLLPAFLILLFGTFLSACLLVLEICNQKYKKYLSALSKRK